MIQKTMLNLGVTVPLNAVKAILNYTVTNGTAPAKLYRFDGDSNPLILRGPKGTCEVDLPKGRILYVDVTDGASWHVSCSGYEF